MRTKNEQIGFRVSATLKKELEKVAKEEARTLSQLCELFVVGGLEVYKKEGPKYLQRFLAQRKSMASE